MPSKKSKSHTRYYELDQLLGKKKVDSDLTIAYVRVSSHDQKEDLKRQVEVLETYCAKLDYNFEVIQDLGSGMNYHKKGLSEFPSLPEIIMPGCWAASSHHASQSALEADVFIAPKAFEISMLDFKALD